MAKKTEPKNELSPALTRFKAWLLEELDNMGPRFAKLGLDESQGAAQQLEALAASFDRIALRCLHASVAERDLHLDQVNPVIQIAVANVTSLVRTAARDLEAKPHVASQHEAFGKALAEVAKHASAIHRILSQPGMAPYVLPPDQGPALFTDKGAPAPGAAVHPLAGMDPLDRIAEFDDKLDVARELFTERGGDPLDWDDVSAAWSDHFDQDALRAWDALTGAIADPADDLRLKD